MTIGLSGGVFENNPPNDMTAKEQKRWERLRKKQFKKDLTKFCKIYRQIKRKTKSKKNGGLIMDEHTSYEQAYKNGYDKGYEAGVKEFAKKLKERKYKSSDWSHGEHPFVVEESDIDEIAEEMVGEEDGKIC